LSAKRFATIVFRLTEIFRRGNFQKVIDRIVRKSYSHKAAHEWDIAQENAMTPGERLKIAKILKEKVWGKTPPDVRECHQNQTK